MKRTTINDRLKRTLQAVLAAAALAGAGQSAQAQFGSYNVSPMGGVYGMGRLGGPLVVADFSGGYGAGAAAYGGYAAPYSFPASAGYAGAINSTGNLGNPSFRGISTPGVGIAFNSLGTGPNLGTTDPLFGFRQPRMIVDPVTGLALQQSATTGTGFNSGLNGQDFVGQSNSFPAGTVHIFGANNGVQTGINRRGLAASSPINVGTTGNTFVDQSNAFPPGTVHIFQSGTGVATPIANTGSFVGPGGTFVDQSNSFAPGTIHIFGSNGFSVNNTLRAGLNIGTQRSIFPVSGAATSSFGLTTSLPRR